MPGQVSTPVTFDTAADLSASTNRYLCGKITSTGFNVCDTAGEMVDGVIDCGGASSASAQRGPIVTVRAGAAFAKGAKLSTNALGKAITATTGYHVFARALEAAGAAGDEVKAAMVMSFAPSLSVESVAAVSAAGAIPTTADHVLLTVSGTVAYTLDDGDIGHEITIECISAAATPLGTVTMNGAQAAYGSERSAYTFSAAGQLITLRMTSTGWKLIRKRRAGSLTVVVGTTVLTSHVLSEVYNLSIDGTVTSTLTKALPDPDFAGEAIEVRCTTADNTPAGNLDGNFKTVALVATTHAAVNATTDYFTARSSLGVWLVDDNNSVTFS